MGGFAWVTLATNDSYSLGALVLAHSLKRVGTKYDLAVLITPGVTEVMREKLSSVFSLVKEVNVLDSKDEANLALLARPELGITFTKLHCWRLTQYDKCVFIDADTLVIKNSDELFEREELSAAPDVGWPDCFNSGVFVFKPSQITFASLTSHAKSQGSFDGGDQGLLNSFFSDWAHKDISKHLPFIYNMCSTASYSYLPAFKQFGDDVKIIHFIGSTKPWLQYFDTLTGQVQPHSDTGYLQPMLQHWWNIFCENVHPQLSPVMAGIAGALAKITLGETRSSEQVALEEHMRKYGWEQGQIDYMGRDSFDNIWKKISTTLESTLSKSDKSSVKAKSEETDEKLPIKTTENLTETVIEKLPDEITKIDAAEADDILEKKIDLTTTTTTITTTTTTTTTTSTTTTAQEKEEKKIAVNETKEISSTSTTIEPLSVSSPEPILALTAPLPILSIKEHGENQNDNKIDDRIQQSKKLKNQNEQIVSISDNIIPLGFTSSTVVKDLENLILKESVSEKNKSKIEQSISPELEKSTVEDSSSESKKDFETHDTIKSEIKTITEFKNTDSISKTSNEFLTDVALAQTSTDKIKDRKIPATPTVIEATPPTSPQCETNENEIQAPKKITRKIIKKQKLNQDDDAIESTSDNKKKNTTELNENLEPDESVPETPPPISVNPPTPPKRKVKTLTTKNTTKKN